MIQQPKDDALTNFDTEHVTENLVTTILQKLKSYLDAAKGNLADNDNNKTFPSRYTLEQRSVENERVPTAESPTVKWRLNRQLNHPTHFSQGLFGPKICGK